MTTENNRWGEGKCNSSVMLSSSSWCGRVGHLIGFIPLNRIPLLLPGEQTPGEHGHRGLAVPHKHVNTAWFHWGTFMCLWPYTLPAWLFDAVGKAGRLFSSAFLPGDSYLCCLFSQSVLAGRAGQCRPPSVLPHSTTLLLPCGGFAMWRNWHRDKITLVLFSDLKECKLAALTNLLTWQMLLLTSPCNPALCLFLSLHPAGHRLTMRALVRCHRAIKQKSSSSGRLAQVRHGPEPHSLGRDLPAVFMSADNASDTTEWRAAEFLSPPVSCGEKTKVSKPLSWVQVSCGEILSNTPDSSTSLHSCLPAGAHMESAWWIPCGTPSWLVIPHQVCGCQQTSQTCNLHVLSYLKPAFSMLCSAQGGPRGKSETFQLIMVAHEGDTTPRAPGAEQGFLNRIPLSSARRNRRAHTKLLRKGEGGTNLLPSILLSSHKWGAGAPHFCVLRECVCTGLGIISGFTWISEAVAAQLRIHICGRS